MYQREKSAVPYRVLEEFRYEIRRFLNFSERAARLAGVEPHQHQALLVIKSASAENGATIGSLARRLLIRHHSAVELSDRLEEKRLIRRSRSGVDRRKVFLSLTPAGEKLLEELSELHRTELQTTGPRLLNALENIVHRAELGGDSEGRGEVGRHPGAAARDESQKTGTTYKPPYQRRRRP